jgi:hypothetical protein
MHYSGPCSQCEALDREAEEVEDCIPTVDSIATAIRAIIARCRRGEHWRIPHDLRRVLVDLRCLAGQEVIDD